MRMTILAFSKTVHQRALRTTESNCCIAKFSTSFLLSCDPPTAQTLISFIDYKNTRLTKSYGSMSMICEFLSRISYCESTIMKQLPQLLQTKGADKRRQASVRLFTICSTVMVQWRSQGRRRAPPKALSAKPVLVLRAVVEVGFVISLHALAHVSVVEICRKLDVTAKEQRCRKR